MYIMKTTFISTDIDLSALGMRSVSAAVNEAGHQTQLIFMPTENTLYSKKTLDELIALVSDADIVGISCLARGSQKAKQVAELLSPLNKLIVWGGLHASLNPAECADWANIVCRGEGEGMMLDLLERIENGKDWRDIENIVYKENGRLITNSVRPPIDNLDDLPLPDFMFENEYHLVSDKFVRAHGIPETKKEGYVYFNASRGCAFYCTYCCNKKIKSIYPDTKRYVRRMSIPRLIEHAQNLKKIFPDSKYFYFLDEDFAARPVNELIQFAEEYPQKVGLPFECLAHPARITHQKMELLVKAGLWRVNMGIESGSERTRKEVYDRHVSNKAILRAAEIISTYPQVVPYYFLIIANPYEEKDDLITTARLLADLPYGCHVIIYNLVFFPGSALYELAVQDGLIEGHRDSGYELDFLSGYQYKSHAWKKKNLYLNGLLFLMGGVCGRYRLGLLPRFMLNTMLRPKVIEFNERFSFFIQGIIQFKTLFNSTRHLLAKWIKILISDPTKIYNLKYYFKSAST